MLPHSQQQQNLRNIRRLASLSCYFPSRFAKSGQKDVSPKQFAAQYSQSGFTIVEALLAIIVVTILMVGVAPVLVLATANRVQGKRVEVAVNAAKSYIDRVRSDPSLTPPINTSPDQTNPRPSALYFAGINAPYSSGILVCDANTYCSRPAPNTNFKLFCIDGDGDGVCTKNSLKDMVVQASGYQAKNSNSGIGSLTDEQKAELGYQLGIRVYRADAFRDNGLLKKSTDSTKAQGRANTAGLGIRKAPLAEMTAQIITDDTKYSDLCEQTGGCQ